MMLALFWLANAWLITGIFGTTANPRLLTTLGTLFTIVAGNAVLLFGGLKPTFHWLRIASIFSIGVMLAPMILFILDPFGR
ncbi:hypothetical protein [Polymorphobacter arshaanensis]|uniref:hypothetical protein n=1 Tax=Glacieibacterium arshaanense TaxID=2511025 RepID=UPI00140D8CB1|nr:hypothetical protein [Polymorphobacter arshaanensis]